MATSGDRYLATSGDFPMARDRLSVFCRGWLRVIGRLKPADGLIARFIAAWEPTASLSRGFQLDRHFGVMHGSSAMRNHARELAELIGLPE